MSAETNASSENIALGPGNEFDIVRTLLAEWGEAAERIGDDAAILQVPAGEKLVVSTDTSLEGVHFQRDWLNHFEIGYRATAAALSDLAAMAARPLGLVIALTLPEADREEARAIATGIGEGAAAVLCPIVGGDLTAGKTLSLTITALGSVARPLTRSGAVAGQHVYVTGRLGGPAAALRAWRAGREPSERDRARFANPVPRIDAAIGLAERGATSGNRCLRRANRGSRSHCCREQGLRRDRSRSDPAAGWYLFAGSRELGRGIRDRRYRSRDRRRTILV